MTAKPIEIEQLWDLIGDGDYGDVIEYYAKGHHDPAEFIRALEDQWDYTGPVSAVKLIHARMVPSQHGGYTFHVSQPGRGAFPATYIHKRHTRFILDDEGHGALEPCKEVPNANT